jgi:tRNA pseudouridine38-40 synthase
LIKKASKLLLGTHNFKSFSITDVEDTVRTISKFNITKQKDYINIEITGNGFLRGMVRMIVGALLDINENKKTLNDISDLLNNPKKGSSITKARAAGLYLKKVYYKI